MSLDNRWKNPQGQSPQQLYLALQDIVRELRRGIFKAPSYEVADVPPADATGAEGSIIYISNEAGGAVLAFSDGTNWRRVTDRAIIS